MTVTLKNLQNAGEFEVIDAKLHGNGVIIDLKENLSMAAIKWYEDISWPCIHGELIITTTHAYADQLPILGQEKLELILGTPDFPEQFDFGGELEDGRWFDVYAVENRSHDKNLQSFVIKFASPESLTNARITFSESLQGTYSEIVGQVMLDHIDTKKAVFLEATNGEKNVVVTTQHPFNVIGTAASHSLTDDKKLPAFRFFENREGFHFKSVSTLFKQPSIWKFGVNAEGLKQTGQGQADLVKDLQSLTHMTLSQNDRLMDTEDGVIGAKLIAYDIFNKQYKTQEYSYFVNYPQEEHVEHEDGGGPIYRTEDSDYTKSRVYYQPVSIKKKNGMDFNGLFSSYKLESPVEDIKTAQKNSQLNQLDQAFKLECSALGNLSLTVGKMVDIVIPKATEELMGMVPDDEIFSGKFLITSIMHNIELTDGGQHTSTMTLVRDSIPDTTTDF